MKKTVLSLTLLFALVLTAYAQKPTATKIMNTIDDIMSINSDVTASVKMLHQKKAQGVKTYEATYFRRDSDDSFLIVMNAPESEKGNGYLRTGDNFWMYRKNTRSFQHINRDESIAGTDIKGGDFEAKKWSEQYAPLKDANGVEIVEQETLGKVAVYKFTMIATVNDVTYPKQIVWVNTSTLLPMKIEGYSLSGTHMATSLFLKYTAINGKYIAVQSKFTDEFKGDVSAMMISDIKTARIQNAVFTKAYLENLSK